MTDQVNEAVATLSERRQWVRHAAETYARANDDAKVRVLRKEEAALGLAIQSLQNAHPARGVVDEAFIAKLGEEAYRVHSATRVGPYPNDSHAPKWQAVVRMVIAALEAQAAAQPAVPSVPEGMVLVPRVPTIAMENAWEQHYGNTFKGRYSSMLAAATPKDQPAQGVG